MAKSKIKVKTVEITNNLLPTKPKLYKPALQTPTVVSSEKFIENIAKETGLSRFQAANVLSCVFQTAGDYMELGNAVQLHEDFGTLKPYIKVKAVSDKDKCNAECIQGMGLRLIPTGKMRTLLGDVQFVFTGMSNGSDVEDSELVDPNDPSGNGGGGGGSNNNQQQGTQQTAEKYRVTFKFADNTEDDHEYEAGETINYPTNTTGYQWPTSKPNVMPAQNVTVTEEAIPSTTERTITYKHNGSVHTTQQYAVGAAVTAPEAPTGYSWMGVPSVMPDRDVEISSFAGGGEPGDL